MVNTTTRATNSHFRKGLLAINNALDNQSPTRARP
jgi:hypothetical protein